MAATTNALTMSHEPKELVVFGDPIQKVLLPNHGPNGVEDINDKEHDIDKDNLGDECGRGRNEKAGAVELDHSIKAEVGLMKNPVHDEEQDKALEEGGNDDEDVAPVKD